VDSVILAAGRGSRLNGIAAPFHKPLMVVNGRPIIRQCVECAQSVTDGSVIVVAAPDNAAPIAHVLAGAGLDNVDIIVQPKPLGPGHALLTGMKLVTSIECLVLLGDNILSCDDVQRVVHHAASNVVGVNRIPAADAERFTRLRQYAHGVSWVEKVEVTDDDLDVDRFANCWVGPLKVDPAAIKPVLSHAFHEYVSNGRELPIGTFLNDINAYDVVDVTSIDIGVPDAL
jgi:bifunctional N-acetylglucosamine-1-phosphate-uridyltransferase/glucosamine-1-phosphate-acetyltransferase GlmU-like protein